MSAIGWLQIMDPYQTLRLVVSIVQERTLLVQVEGAASGILCRLVVGEVFGLLAVSSKLEHLCGISDRHMLDLVFQLEVIDHGVALLAGRLDT